MAAVLARPLYVSKRMPAIVWWSIGGLAMIVMQLSNGAALEYSFLSGLFTILVGVAIQACGGIKTIFGLCIVMFATQHVLWSQIAKAFLREPPDARLEVPLYTMAVYCIGMLSFAVGGYLSRYLKFARGASIYPKLTDARFLRDLAIAATIFASLRSGIVTFFNYDQTSSGLTTSGFVGPLRTLAFLDALAVAAGTAATIVGTHGRKSIGPLNIIALGVPVMAGFLGAYRAGVGTAALAYLIACWAYNYKFKFSNILTLVFCGYIFFYILSPYSLAARTQARTSDFFKNLQRSMYVLGDVIANPGKYNEDTTTNESKVNAASKQMRYYTFPNINLERFSMIKNADAIIAATKFRGTMGWRTIIPGLEMLPPSFLYEDKPVLGTANLLAHRTRGLVNQDDVVTQITIGEFADSFSSFGWLGIAAIPGIVLLMYHLFYGLVVKLTLNQNVIAVALVPASAVSFSEGPISTQIVTIVQAAIVAAIGIAMPYYTVRLLDATYLRKRRIRIQEEAAIKAQT